MKKQKVMGTNQNAGDMGTPDRSRQLNKDRTENWTINTQGVIANETQVRETRHR